jgi:type I restriction enzyme M protein
MEVKNQIDKIWDDMFSYGIANPLVVIEQLTYLFFIRSLDMTEVRNEENAVMLGIPFTERIFPDDEWSQSLRWSKFKDLSADKLFELLPSRVFPFIKGENTTVTLEDGARHVIKGMNVGKKTAYAKYMKNAAFSLPNALITEKVITAIDKLPLGDYDHKGDLYEHMIGKLQTAGRIGQFRTPRHIIRMMVRLINPTIDDTMADPACGTGGFLVGAGEHIREHYADAIRTDKKKRAHFHKMFTGYDTDQTMLRITAMNTILHNMDEANIEFRDSLSKDNEDTEKFKVVLANPPFKGSLDHEAVAKSLTDIASTRKTELLFIALFLRMLEMGGRCACIVPDGVLFGTSAAHKAIRRALIEDNRLQAVISMPSGVFKPYAGVSTAVLVFTKTGRGGTDNVWFYDMKSDGYSLDDKREDLGTGGDMEDIVARFADLETEASRTRKDQSFLVPKDEIAAKDYDLSINRYKESDYTEARYDHPSVSIERFRELEEEILAGMEELEGMLG